MKRADLSEFRITKLFDMIERQEIDAAKNMVALTITVPRDFKTLASATGAKPVDQMETFLAKLFSKEDYSIGVSTRKDDGSVPLIVLLKGNAVAQFNAMVNDMGNTGHEPLGRT